MSNLELKKENENVTVAGPRREYYVPEVDIHEKDDSILLLVNVPGANQDSTEVSLEKNILTITANVDLQIPEGFEKYYAENNAGGYKRLFRLTDAVEKDGITASVKDGVLKVTLKKAKELLPRKIEISRG